MDPKRPTPAVTVTITVSSGPSSSSDGEAGHASHAKTRPHRGTRTNHCHRTQAGGGPPDKCAGKAAVPPGGGARGGGDHKDTRLLANIGNDASLYGSAPPNSPPVLPSGAAPPCHELLEVPPGRKDSAVTMPGSGSGGAGSTTLFLKDQFVSFFQVSDNKLAMKLFGNKNALLKEKQRQKSAGHWVIHPCSNFR